MKQGFGLVGKPISLFFCSLVCFNSVCALQIQFGFGICAQEAQQVDVYSQLNRAQALSRDVSFHQPTEIQPGISNTFVDLCVKETINWFNGIELEHRSYNGGLVGPTIRVRPGQNLKVNLRNLLRPESQAHTDSNVPHGFNTTNLHTHGLHVSPNSPADDVFRQVLPGECFEYDFPIPLHHPPGTFWYHANKHGSTALQLASGMAGALIVEGGLDNLPAIRNAEEKVLVLQQFTYREIEGRPAVIDPDLIYGQEGDLIEAVNGVVTPTIVMRPGEIQRWRIIHAGTVEAVRLDISGVNFFEIAVDGLATGTIEEKDSLILYPGYRTDVLVKAPDEQVERLLTSQIKNAENAIRQNATEVRSILKIVVDGDPKPMNLPTPEELEPFAAFGQDDVPIVDENTKRREIRFNVDGTKFLVNGEVFDPNDIRQMIELNTVEEWEIISETGVHPFHIHVNPFASKLKGSDDPWVWRDTIAVRKRQPVILRSRYLQFTGKTVLHCHNLVHEDQGMMQAIKIFDPANPSALSTESTETAESTTLQSNNTFATAPSWKAQDVVGNVRSSEQFKSKPVLLVLHRGMNCLHCAEQLTVLNQHISEFEQAEIDVVAISQFLPEDEDSLTAIAGFKFPVLIDKDLECFKNFECIASDGVPNHGLFFIDRANHIVFENQTEVAVTEKKQLVDRFINLILTTQGD